MHLYDVGFYYYTHTPVGAPQTTLPKSRWQSDLRLAGFSIARAHPAKTAVRGTVYAHRSGSLQQTHAHRSVCARRSSLHPGSLPRPRPLRPHCWLPPDQSLHSVHLISNTGRFLSSHPDLFFFLSTSTSVLSIPLEALPLLASLSIFEANVDQIVRPADRVSDDIPSLSTLSFPQKPEVPRSTFNFLRLVSCSARCRRRIRSFHVDATTSNPHK